mmetsp:Transcript_2377/g.9336  ORF Transcript_2377/g.9336 Transcript_2377/m.9336 type:complete len:1169 (-) Transcript_2377:430-3936(-)
MSVFTARRDFAACCIFSVLLASVQAQHHLLEPLLEKARGRFPETAGSGLCAAQGGREPNVFLTRTQQQDSGFTPLEFAVVESVLFNHPLARVFVFLLGSIDESVFDRYLVEGYCIIVVQLHAAWIQTAIQSVEHELTNDQFALMSADPRAVPFLMNCALASLQFVYGGISLSFDGLLLNPFDMLLPAALPLHRTAVFIERVLAPEEQAPKEALQREDFELSWMPRSHTDRADGHTLICGDNLCPRAMPAGCPLARQLLRAWLEAFLMTGSSPRCDLEATRLYSAYVRNRPQSQTRLEDGQFAVVALPGWVIVEPHFPDGWRHYGHRGQIEESEDRGQFHSQLYTPRVHRERSDWSLVRSLKLWLPLDYGPQSARNAMPRSVVDLAQRFLALRITPFSPGPLRFGTIEPTLTSHTWHTPVDAYEALDNSMAESLGVGARPKLSREVALPGTTGGFRTFRDIRVVGRGACAVPGFVVRVRAAISLSHPGARLFCRPAIRPDGPLDGAPDSEVAWNACRAALTETGFDLTGLPSLVNSALSHLGFWPVRGPGHPPAQSSADGRLSAAELDMHFADLHLELTTDACPDAGEAIGVPKASNIVRSTLHALVDDVQDQVTVVAHSASRCELLERLALSFHSMYDRMLVMVTCECPEPGPEGERCSPPEARDHPTIAFMKIVDVPYDFGLSRGKRLLAQWAQTEFVLVLDDDFVRSPLSCMECMLLHMRSRMHSLTLPFDLLGFPILEDERNFGAFRGQLRATNGPLYLEPMASEAAVDGCMRVGIHPMAFLARTARLRQFKFQDQLPVGEHEQFFYANRYLGLHAAVCFDSTFPHFRVQMSAGYKQRRERMQELATDAFKKIGFQGMMYLLHKCDAYSGIDHNEFIQQNIPPWSISDDTCGPQPEPPTDFVMFFVAIFSKMDDRGALFRRMLRGEAPLAWLPRLAAAAPTRWAFFVEEQSITPPALVEEEAQHGDVVLMPQQGETKGGFTASQLKFAVTFLRDFHFRWLLVAEQDVFVHLEPVLSVLVAQEPPMRSAVGGWRTKAGMASLQSPWLPPQFFALSHDTKHLLASPRVARWLRTDLENGDAAAALNAWLALLDVQRLELQGVHLGWGGAAVGCPGKSSSVPQSMVLPPLAVLHPVAPGELLLMSEAAAVHGSGCEGLNATWANIMIG